MKKLFILIVIIFLSLTFIQSKADCPPGWTSYNFTYYYDTNGDNVGDCMITVYYCTYIYPTGLYDIIIDKVLVEVPCGLKAIGDPNFWPDLNDKVGDHAIENGTFPPCPNSVINMQIRRAKCWKVHNVPPNPIEGTYGFMELLDCGLTGQCKCFYYVCTDYSSNPPKNKKTLIECVEIPGEFCTNEMPLMPPIGKTWNDEWTTECYGITCVE